MYVYVHLHVCVCWVGERKLGNFEVHVPSPSHWHPVTASHKQQEPLLLLHTETFHNFPKIPGTSIVNITMQQ